MPRLEVREACYVNGQPVELGGEVSVDEATARLLILSGRAVVAVDKPQPVEKDEAPKPITRTRARSTTQPTPTQED
jgi:sulfur carrier protein ThiS